MKRVFAVVLVIIVSTLVVNAQQTWVSKDGEYFKKTTLEKVRPAKEPLSINQAKSYQRVHGLGGSFNELGHVALQYAGATEQQQVIDSLFGEEGLRFGYCRIPVGANDFSTNWYSHNATMGDFDMEKFDISRDTVHLIPYVKKALEVNPEVEIWASPWSPPMWLKRNKHYGGQAQNMHWGELYGNNMEEIYENNRFVMEPQYLEAYALYFSKFVSAYKELGLPLKAIHPQNEVGANQLFPSCVWSAEDLAVFTGDYLVPKLAQDHPDIDVWLGTVNIDSVQYVQKFVEKFDNVKGVGVQWDGIRMLGELQKKYPQYQYIQTESECNNGLNEWFTAEHTFDLLYRSFTGGVSYYVYWNMILDDLGLSTWMWRQNSLVTVNRYTGEVTYNPEYYVMKHFSHFIDVGAVMIGLENVPDGIRALAFKNPSDAIVVVLQNPKDERVELQIADSKRKSYALVLEGHSMATVTLK